MTVYFLRRESDGLVKIGCAVNLDRRIRRLASINGAVSLLRSVEGGLLEELAFHRLLAEDHVSGEWFRFTPRILTIELPVAVALNDRETMIALGGHHKVAEKLGVSRETALHWTKRYIPWKWRPAVKALARQQRVKLPADFLETPRAAA